MSIYQIVSLFTLNLIRKLQILKANNQYILNIFNIWNINQIVDNFYILIIKIKQEDTKEKKRIIAILSIVCLKIIHQIFILLLGSSFTVQYHFINFNFIYFLSIHPDLNIVLVVISIECVLILHYVNFHSKSGSFIKSIVLVRNILQDKAASRYKYFNLLLNYGYIRKKVFHMVKMHNLLLKSFTLSIGK